MNQDEAEKFGEAWRDAWNSHDLDRIISHYAHDVVFTSPLVISITGKSDGTLHGIADLRDYFAAGLARFPELHFSEPTAYATVDGVALLYTSVNGRLACEVMQLRDDKVVAVRAHYREPAN